MSQRNLEEIYPLSPMQEGMLFHSLYAPDSGVYFEQLSLEIHGALDIHAFKRAWEQILQRHSILRTGFLWEDLDRPLQVVFRQVDLPFTQLDWMDLPEDECAKRLSEFIEGEPQRSFDLTQPPLMRLTLIRTRAAVYHFIWSHHHLLMDGWSMAILIRDVFSLYESGVTTQHGYATVLPPVKPFRDYIAWLEGQNLEAAQAFWQEQLTGFEAPTSLVLPVPVKPQQDGGMLPGERVLSGEITLEKKPSIENPVESLHLPPKLSVRLREIAQQNQITLNTIMQGMWALLLHRYSGEQDLVFGTTVSGRPASLVGSADMVGLFINTLPVRVQVDPGAPVLTWLKELQVDQAAMRQYEFTPLVQIQGWSDVPRGMPLFESILVFENYPVDQALKEQSGTLLIRNVRHFGKTNFPLTVIVAPGKEISIQISYDPGILDSDAIQRMLGHMGNLLESLSSNPAAKIADLRLLTEPEEGQIISIFSFGAAASQPAEKCIHHFFENQVDRAPDAVALVAALVHSDYAAASQPVGNARLELTYRDLNQRANLLAGYLQRCGVGRGSLVGLHLTRSPEMIVGMLGVLKAGGAYLPLDPNYPLERLAFMLGDAGVSVLLTQTILSANLATVYTGWVIYLDQAWTEIEGGWSFPEETGVGHDDPAYVIYTSGTTGKPKGVVVSHRSLLNHAQALASRMELLPGDRMLQFISLSFDASAEEIFPSLTTGATLVLPPAEAGRPLLISGRSILRFCDEHSITHLHLPASLWHQCVDDLVSDGRRCPADLKTLLVGGESPSFDKLQAWSRALDHRIQFINAYGPTETTITAITYRTILEPEIAPGAIPIGRPIENVQAYILDDQRRLVPLGVTGELFIGGLGVAHGYLNRPELTAERFVPDPFGAINLGSSGSGSDGGNSADAVIRAAARLPTRLYRTGDLARFLPDGNIQFMGRADSQVKLRGFRIELGEIEAVLRTHPSVQDCLVVLRQIALTERMSAGDSQLVAYLIPLITNLPVSEVSTLPEASKADLEDTDRRQNLAEGFFGAEEFIREYRLQIQQYLKERLPEYMLPSFFVIVEAWPRTPGGKIDHKMLPPPESDLAGYDRAYTPPRTPVEEIVCGILGDLLGAPRVGINDNFFELGGHSLKATQLISRLRQVFNIELPLRNIFEQPTVSRIAQQITDALEPEQRLSTLEEKIALASGESVFPLRTLQRDLNTGLPLHSPPVSFAQQRLWFLDQLDPHNPAYNIPLVVRIRGQLDVAVFEWGFNQIVQRHEALRTTFETIDGRPVQKITPAAPGLVLGGSVVPVIDLSHNYSKTIQTGSETMIPEEAWRLCREQVSQPFDLLDGPLWRVLLLRLSDTDHILAITIHHIISDGWSMGILVQELSGFYQAKLHGSMASTSTVDLPLAGELPPLTIQYADYAAWQREWFQAEVLQNQLDYWKQKLTGIPPLLDLPTDRPRPAVKTARGAVRSLSLSEELSSDLLSLCRKEGVTIYMCLLAAWQTLLHRYSGQEDICVGTAIANRTRSEVEGLIGFFVNTLVMRGDLSGNPTFRELLGRVRETALGAYAHQDLPFEMLVEELQPGRNLSYSPLFQVGFDFQDAPLQARELNKTRGLSTPPGTGLTFTPIQIESGTAIYDLLLSITRPGSSGSPDIGLIGTLEYNTDLYDPTTIDRMIDHLKVLLQAIITDPDQRVTNLPLLTEAERKQLLIDWNDSYLQFPQDRCIHHRFEEWVERRPEGIALIFENQQRGTSESMTYADLNQLANTLAAYLRKQGVQAGSLVGISTERSMEMIFGVLGVLKAGGAYLPIDPTYPEERLAFMLADSGISLLLTQNKLVDRFHGILNSTGASAGIGLEKTVPPRLICLDADWETIALEARNQMVEEHFQAKENFRLEMVTPDDLAYVIYTSGSTGKPKGVMLQHRGLVNLAEAQRQKFGIDENSCILQFSPFSFDASVWETFMALANGATLCLARQVSQDLIELLRQRDITTVTLPPSVLNILPADQISVEALPALHTVIAAGEACSQEIVSRWAPGRHFYNAYGPTETTVCASWALCDPVKSEAGIDIQDPPIGRPVGNLQLYVLDQNLQPVPVGVPGELHVGGVGLARGYLDRPGLTAERFIPNPFAKRSSINMTYSLRLYRTGDLVRYRIDGNMEFLGRIDRQVKVRGFRIELGEIEAALRQYADSESLPLREAVVVVREDNPGDKRLVAYIVPDDVVSETSTSEEGQAARISDGAVSGQRKPPSASSLRSFLRASLPEYMLPAAFVVMESLPITPSGKVDRNALARLPAPEAGRQELSVPFLAPRTTVEQELTMITASLLGIPQKGDVLPIGVNDNFFELGGHSLLATQYISRIRESFHVELPLRTLFEHPTIAELAEQIDLARQSGPQTQPPAIQRVSRQERRMKREELDQ